MVELNGIELGASRFRPSACRYDRSPPWVVDQNGGAERDRTRCESIPTVGLSIRPLTPLGL